jgi:hypothetical protein
METFQGVTYDLPCCSIPPRPLISQLIVIEIGDKRVQQSCSSTPHTITVIQQTRAEQVTFYKILHKQVDLSVFRRYLVRS